MHQSSCTPRSGGGGGHSPRLNKGPPHGRPLSAPHHLLLLLSPFPPLSLHRRLCSASSKGPCGCQRQVRAAGPPGEGAGGDQRDPARRAGRGERKVLGSRVRAVAGAFFPCMISLLLLLYLSLNARSDEKDGAGGRAGVMLVLENKRYPLPPILLPCLGSRALIDLVGEMPMCFNPASPGCHAVPGSVFPRNWQTPCNSAV